MSRYETFSNKDMTEVDLLTDEEEKVEVRHHVPET
jgi:hypothetical protein